MRLIDADALKKTMKAALLQIIFSDADDEEIQEVQIGEKVVRDLVDEQPTIDAAPVVHARWERCFEDWRQQIEGDECSACGFKHYGTSIDHYHYCPACGAKMDEKEDEENADA